MGNSINTREPFAAWAVIRTDDLTEGRSGSYPVEICATPEVARRIGARGFVQGSDCPVERVTAFRINGTIYAPVRLHMENQQDAEKREAREAREAAEARARSAGLSDADIQLIKDNP